jgi:hypothetical protein
VDFDGTGAVFLILVMFLITNLFVPCTLYM